MNRDCKALNAEVERLTKENVELKACGRQAIDAGEKIIERLTKELEEAIQRGVVLAIKSEKNEHRADTLRATIERLTKERDFQLAAAVEATRREQEHKARADALAAELAKVRGALRGLSNEAKGLEAFKSQIREVVGLNNWTCLMNRVAEARAAELAKAREALAAIRDLPETKPTLEVRHYWHQAQTIARAALPATPEPQP